MRLSGGIGFAVLTSCIAAVLCMGTVLTAGCVHSAKVAPQATSRDSTPTARPDDIVFVRDDEVWCAHMDGTGAVKLTADGLTKDSAEWFPDHRHVLYVSYVPNSQSHPRSVVSVAPVSGGSVRTWPVDGGIVGGATCSPDGTRVAFAVLDRDTRHYLRERVFVLELASGKSTKALELHDHWANSVSWSPDGTRLLLAAPPQPPSRERTWLGVLTLASRKFTWLKTPCPLPELNTDYGMLEARWAPDGKSMVVKRSSKNCWAVAVADANGIAGCVLARGRPSVEPGGWLLPSVYYSSDSQWVFYQDDSAHTIFAVRPDGTGNHEVVSTEGTSSATSQRQ